MISQFNDIQKILKEEINYNFDNVEEYNLTYKENIFLDDYCSIFKTIESGTYVYWFKYQNVTNIRTWWEYFIKWNKNFSESMIDVFEKDIEQECN